MAIAFCLVFSHFLQVPNKMNPATCVLMKPKHTWDKVYLNTLRKTVQFQSVHSSGQALSIVS